MKKYHLTCHRLTLIPVFPAKPWGFTYTSKLRKPVLWLGKVLALAKIMPGIMLIIRQYRQLWDCAQAGALALFILLV